MKPSTVDQYIDAAPVQAKPMLRELRSLLRQAAPGAAEAIKWGVPVMEQNRILFSYGAYKSHINFMPLQSSIAPFKAELDRMGIITGKDTIQLSYDRPLPRELLLKIALHRMKDVLENGAMWMG